MRHVRAHARSVLSQAPNTKTASVPTAYAGGHGLGRTLKMSAIQYSTYTTPEATIIGQSTCLRTLVTLPGGASMVPLARDSIMTSINHPADFKLQCVIFVLEELIPIE